MRPLPARYLCPAPSVTWVTEQRCTLVMNEENMAVFQMTSLGEVLWDCLVQGFSYSRMVRILAEMRGDTFASTVGTVAAILREWRELGLVQVLEEGHG